MQINLPQSTKQIKSEHNRAIFEVEGLYPGYGVTLGNALRRALLSSLKGAAITGVKIKGAQHEFSAIPGISEDVIEIILNLRQIRFKLHSDEPVKLNLSVKGEKEVKASDIQTTSEVEIINPEARIATLNDKKAELEMEIEVESGFGFVPVEIRRKEKLEIGLIAVDAVFAPIKKVNFEVENMRVGDRTDFNRLRLDIETDGKEEEESGQKEEEAQDSGKIKIEDLKLSTRTANALAEAGIKTAGGLAKKTEDSLREMEGMGEKGITEVKKALKKLGLGLKEEV